MDDRPGPHGAKLLNFLLQPLVFIKLLVFFLLRVALVCFIYHDCSSVVCRSAVTFFISPDLEVSKELLEISPTLGLPTHTISIAYVQKIFQDADDPH